MLAQFQEKYPQACLLSQLLTIYQGKFVVQVSVQIEGVVRATGMAAAETIELAEDQARTRAIALVANQEITSVPQKSDRVTFNPQVTDTDNSDFSNLESSFTPTANPTKNYPEFTPKNSKDLLLTELNCDPVIDEDFGIEPINPSSSNPAPTFSNVTPFVSRAFKDDLPLDPLPVAEPIDLSDTLIAIETELRNLRWTAKQEHNYLQRIYKKESRDLLNTQQLYEFLNYLQVFAQTSKQLERLGWDNQQGQDYLLENYNKKSRQYLSYQELTEFLQHLQATS